MTGNSTIHSLTQPSPINTTTKAIPLNMQPINDTINPTLDAKQSDSQAFKLPLTPPPLIL